MADSIVTARVQRAGRTVHWSGYFLYDIDPPILAADNVTQIPVTPQAGIPAFDKAMGLFDAAELAAFDAGDMMWSGEAFKITAEQANTPADLIKFLRAQYAAENEEGEDRLAAMRREFARYGRRITP